MTEDHDLLERQRLARESFDLDATIAALPPDGPIGSPSPSFRGQAGVRLRAHLGADISDDLLREMARETLGAQRCSEQYLDALRVVLGNQADAERYDYILEMNVRVSFAPERVMRTIIDQMQAAGITFGKLVAFGAGRCQVVQCYAPKADQGGNAAARINLMSRKYEDQDEARRSAAHSSGDHPKPASDRWTQAFLAIDEAEVPHWSKAVNVTV